MINGEAKQEGKITIFQLRDDLTPNKVKAFVKKLSQIVSFGQRYIVLDLSDTEEVCLLGMVAISSIFNKCRQNGGALKITGLNPIVRRAFRKTNLINTIEVYDEVLDAIKSFKQVNLLKSKQYSGSFFLRESNSFVGWDRLPLMGLVQ